ncbi:hypothetical protein [Microtetraspora sp. NBRC 16547]|uniref:hypothetical protein n=1 Tax=Microtetraspora sp. NBRC 16547 TaxID=3030993 RepID=UPI0024A55645|nr:hypothetical protein [Microtetraspora sp. NBRC 16547]GLX02781.1 hypothetical protein Misp02_68670 [Microtetraspora sp. NBRC 16547]
MPNPLLRLCLPAMLLALPLYGVFSGPAGAAADSRRPDEKGTIGIKLLEAPKNRMDDPRARVFVVDHVNPGTTFTRRLQVNSSSSKRQHVEVYAAAADVAHGSFTFAPGRTSNELSSWIKLDRSAIDLPPHGSSEVTATIGVPKSAPEGEQYAVIWAQVSTGAPSAKRNVALVNRVGVRAYLDVGPGGDPPSEFRIGDVIPRRTEDGHPAITAAVRNTGRRALDLDGQLALSDGPGSVRAGPFRVAGGTTLAPGDEGTVSVVLDDRLPPGPWTFRLIVQSGRVKHAVTGTLTFPEESGGRGTPAALDSPFTKIFWLVVGVSLISALALLVAGLTRGRRR